MACAADLRYVNIDFQNDIPRKKKSYILFLHITYFYIWLMEMQFHSFFYQHLENIAKFLCKSVMETRLVIITK